MSTALGNSDDVLQIEVVPEESNESQSSRWDQNESSVVLSVKNSWIGKKREWNE